MNEISKNIELFVKNKLPEVILSALEDACQIVENDAVDNCPFDDSTLRASITHSIKNEDYVFTGSVGSNLEYAPYVHEGTGIYAKDGNGRKNVPWTYKTADGEFYSTKGQKPKQFLQKAIDENLDNIKNCFEGCLEE